MSDGPKRLSSNAKGRRSKIKTFINNPLTRKEPSQPPAQPNADQPKRMPTFDHPLNFNAPAVTASQQPPAKNPSPTNSSTPASPSRSPQHARVASDRRGSTPKGTTTFIRSPPRSNNRTVTSPPGLQHMQPAPVISSSDQIAAELSTLFRGNIPRSREKELRPASAPRSLEGLEQLAEHGFWNHVLSKADSLIKTSAKDTPVIDVLKLFNYKLSAQIRLRQFEQAQQTCRDLVPYATKAGDAKPFNLDLLEAELPSFSGNAHSAIERMVGLYAMYCQRLAEMKDQDAADEDVAQCLSRKRAIVFRLVKLYMQQQDFVTATKFLLGLSKDLPYDLTVMNCLARVYLQQGDVCQAKALFEHISRINKVQSIDMISPTKSPSLNNLPRYHSKLQDHEYALNSASILVAESKFQDAMVVMEELINRYPKEPAVVNNYAIVALYTNNITAAVQKLEALIAVDPIQYVTETVVFNLCTLYELTSTRPEIKKQVMERVVILFAADDFDKSALQT